MKSRFRTGHGPERGIGQGSSATAARYPAQYQARAGFRHRALQRTRHRPELRPAEPFSAPAAACRSVIRPGYSARTRTRPAGSTRGLPPRISDPARVRTLRKARFAANIRTTSAYSRTPHGAGHRNKPRNRGCTPVPHTRFRHERPPVRLFSQKPVQIPLRRLEQTAVESERSSMHAVYGARTEQHLPLLRLQIGNPLLESAKPTLQILHTYYNQSGGRTLFAASGEAKIKK